VHEYDLIADWYATERVGPGGVPEVESLIARLRSGAAVLDVGCGHGLPLTKELLEAGCKVVAVDSSPRMLERFQVNCPGTPFICSPIQSADLDGHIFDAAIAWGVLFPSGLLLGPCSLKLRRVNVHLHSRAKSGLANRSSEASAWSAAASLCDTMGTNIAIENGVGVIRVSAHQARPASVTARDAK
jgi:SAM-dependent methyltransferase